MIKLLVLDLDGTLFNSNAELSEKNRRAVILAQQAGVRIALASGRSYFSLKELCERLEMPKYSGFVIGNNGQDLYDFKEGSLTKGAKIAHSACLKVFKIAHRFNLEVFGHDNEIFYFYSPEGLEKLHPERDSYGYNPDTGFFEVDGDMDKIGLFIAEGRTDCYEILTALKEEISEAQVTLVNSNCIELVPPNMDKVNGIDLIVKRCGFQKDEILVMGDGQNDLGMAKRYPFVAMANALSEVKAAACRLTLSNDEDGVAYEIENKILKD